MFAITHAKGFHMTFANGWTVSVQFGHRNYCDNRDVGGVLLPARPSKNAEIAAWSKEGKWYDFGNDTVKGYVDANDVLEFMNMIAAK